MALRLFTKPNNYRAQKTLVAANYASVEIETPQFRFPDDLESKEFLLLTPAKKVPVLETPDGPLFESNAILRYVARSRPDANLYGSSFYESGLVEQWLDFSANELEPWRNVWLYPIIRVMELDVNARKFAIDEIKRVLGILNQHLLSRTFLVGQFVTIADIAIASALASLYQKVFDPQFRSQFVNVCRWFDLLIHQQEFLDVFGEIKLCEKMEEAPLKKKKKQKGGGKKGRGEGGGGKENKTGKLSKEEEKTSGDVVKKNPLSLLPPPEIEMGAIKVLLSDGSTSNALEEIRKKEAGKANYSFYTSTFTKDLFNQKHANGICSRLLKVLEPIREYGYGKVNILGEDPKGKCCLEGAWIFRGDNIPFEFSDCRDYGSYAITKIVLGNHEQRAEFQSILDGVKGAVLEQLAFT